MGVMSISASTRLSKNDHYRPFPCEDIDETFLSMRPLNISRKDGFRIEKNKTI